MCLDCEAYGLKKHRFTRSDCIQFRLYMNGKGCSLELFVPNISFYLINKSPKLKDLIFNQRFHLKISGIFKLFQINITI